MLGSWPFMCAFDPWRLAGPGGVRWIGLGVAAAGAVLAIGGVLQLRGLENIDHLATTGPYSRLRHPMYAGFVLWIGGWVVAYGDDVRHGGAALDGDAAGMHARSAAKGVFAGTFLLPPA